MVVLSDFLCSVFLFCLHLQIMLSFLKGWDQTVLNQSQILMYHERRYFYSLMLTKLQAFWSEEASIPVVLMLLVAAPTKVIFLMFAQGNHNLLLLSTRLWLSPLNTELHGKVSGFWLCLSSLKYSQLKIE